MPQDYLRTSSSCPGFPGQFNAFPYLPCFPGIYHALPEFSMLTWYFWDFWRNKPTSGSRIKARDLPGLPGQHFLGWDFPCFPGIPGISSVFLGYSNSMLSQDFLFLAGISYAFPGFPTPSRDFPWITGIFQVFVGLCFLEAVLFLLLYCARKGAGREKHHA